MASIEEEEKRYLIWSEGFYLRDLPVTGWGWVEDREKAERFTHEDAEHYQRAATRWLHGVQVSILEA